MCFIFLFSTVVNAQEAKGIIVGVLFDGGNEAERQKLPLYKKEITNEKLLSTEYGDGWTLDDYEVAEHTDGHWKGMWEIQVKRITHPDSGSLGI